MPNNYSTNFFSFWINLLPDNKRRDRYIAWGKTLMYPLQWLHDRFFIDYKTGTIYANWNVLTTYTKGSFVKYTDKKIYFAISNPPIGTLPTNETYWIKTQDNFVGFDERMKYRSQIITFEYALNKWFDIPFVQPPLVNQIYIINNLVMANVFRVGEDDMNTSFASLNALGIEDYVGTGTVSNNQYSFTIYYPSSLPAILGLNATIVELQIRSLVDTIKLSGTIYNIISY